MKKHIVFTILVSFLLILTACEKDEEKPPVTTSEFTDGVFITSEGAFPDGTGTVSFWKRDGSAVYHEIYQQANNLVPLGNIVQSIKIIGKTAYIAVNNANRVEMVDAGNFQSKGSFENINTPAYIINAMAGKIYVSSWDNVLYILNEGSTEVQGQIAVGNGPTRMEKVNDLVWVLNNGGFNVGNSISVIDPVTDQVVQTMQVPKRPSGIVQDNEGIAWILCQGMESWQGTPTKGHLISIDPVDYSIQKDVVFPDTIHHPEFLLIDHTGQYLFYNYPDGIYRFDMEVGELAGSPLIPRAVKFYSIAYDPKVDVLYGSDAVDYKQRGWVFRYRASDGAVIDSVKAGVVPRGFEFVE